jgi:hypothetical protein
MTSQTRNSLAPNLTISRTRSPSALRHEGRKSQHDSDRLNADIVAKRLVRHLDRRQFARRA